MISIRSQRIFNCSTQQ